MHTRRTHAAYTHITQHVSSINRQDLLHFVVLNGRAGRLLTLATTAAAALQPSPHL